MHAKRAMEKLEWRVYKVRNLRKVVAGLCGLAEQHGIGLEELGWPGTQDAAEQRGAGLDEQREETGSAPIGGGGGLVGGGVLEVGLVHPPSTNYQVVSSASKEQEEPVLTREWEGGTRVSPTVAQLAAYVEAAEKRFDEAVVRDIMKLEGMPEPVEVTPIDPKNGIVEVSFSDPEPEANVKAEEWPAEATLRVVGPCPNPALWQAHVLRGTGMLLTDKDRVSLETSPRKRYQRGMEVKAKLVRGGGSPLYRSVE
jgi:hypothetical protein